MLDSYFQVKLFIKYSYSILDIMFIIIRIRIEKNDNKTMRNFKDRKFEVIILKIHYCYLVQHSLKYIETYFVPLINKCLKSYLVVGSIDDTSR